MSPFELLLVVAGAAVIYFGYSAVRDAMATWRK